MSGVLNPSNMGTSLRVDAEGRLMVAGAESGSLTPEEFNELLVADDSFEAQVNGLNALGAEVSDATAAAEAAALAAADAQSDIDDHEADTANPHAVTKAQVGLSNVTNVAQEPAITAGTADDYWRGDKTWQNLGATVRGTLLTGYTTIAAAAISATDSVLDAFRKLQAQITADLAVLNAHTGNTSNPHSVTKAQVGLSNVDNTSDANKPVSTAQATADGLRVLKAGDTMTGDLRINANLGLNVAPGARLDILAGTTNRFRMSESSSTLFFDSLNAAASAWLAKTERALSYSWQISGGGAGTGVDVDGSGNVGVGTSTITNVISGSNRLLNVAAANGAEIVLKRTAGGANIALGVASDNNGYLYSTTGGALLVGVNNAERMRIDASGNVGIGTASPLNVAGYTYLTINNAVSGNGVTLYRSGVRTASFNVDSSNAAAIGTEANSNFTVYTNGLDRMRVKASGGVRIIPLATAPSSPEQGELWYSSSAARLYCFDGTIWQPLH